MPVDEPQFGEVWTTTDIGSGRIMQGIIADVSPTRVLFVSLAGNRVAVPLSRLRTSWNFVQPAPRRSLPPCERSACVNAGMLEYERSDRVLRTCPKHAPFGTQCRITQNWQPPTEQRNIRPGFECRSIPCPTCGDRDPAEDVRVAFSPARLWLCTSCSGRWVTLPRILDDPQDIDHLCYTIGHDLARIQCEVDSILVVNPNLWVTIRQNAGEEADAGEAVPRTTIRGMQAFLNAAAITETHREFFQAVMRVRSNTIRQVDRPVQRLGGSPNRGGVVGSAQNPVRPAPAPAVAQIPYAPIVPEGTQQAAADTLRRLRQEDQQQRAPVGRDIFEAPNIVETPIPDIPIDRESIWVQRLGGHLMVVLDIIKATDGTDAISFRRSSAEDIEPAVTMSRRDFLSYHRPFVSAASSSADAAVKPSQPIINVSIDEEWQCQDGSGMIITQVDFRKEIVYGDDLKTKKHRQIPFVQFVTGRWRKVVRKSVYERLRQPEISLDTSQDDE